MKKTGTKKARKSQTGKKRKAEKAGKKARKKTSAAKPRAVARHESRGAETASRLIDRRIEELGDWRGQTIALVRKLIRAAVPGVVEEWKWRGVPTWSQDGIICTGETYKEVVKTTFAKGASLADPERLFNASLDGNVRRAIDFREGESVDAAAFKALVRQAAALNAAKARKARG
jgi:hypothetical protein